MKREYNENGNCIYIEWKSGYWVKYEYDSDNNKCIYIKWSDGDIQYPNGKEYYLNYKRKQKIKRLLNE